MSLFRSRLFQWLARSWPVRWGRQTRQRLQRPLRAVQTLFTDWVGQVEVKVRSALAPVWETAVQGLLPAAARTAPPPLLLLTGEALAATETVTAGKAGTARRKVLPRRSPRLLGGAIGVRLARLGRAALHRWRTGALAPPTTILDRRMPRPSFAEILAEAIEYYFGRAKPSLPSEAAEPLPAGGEVAIPAGPGPAIATAPVSIWIAEETVASPVWDTRAVFLGYAYGPLLEFLLWLDRLVERIENLCLRIWQWLRQRWAAKDP